MCLQKKTSEAVEETIAKTKEVGNLVTAELVFPFKSSHHVIAGIPEMYLPCCGPKTLSHYHCQVPSCTLDFAQKAAACNHVHSDHLNVALACLTVVSKEILRCIHTVLLLGSIVL